MPITIPAENASCKFVKKKKKPPVPMWWFHKDEVSTIEPKEPLNRHTNEGAALKVEKI